MMQWFIKAIKNYAGFSGRSSRAEYGYFMLGYFLIVVILATIENRTTQTNLLTGVVWLALLIPSLAVSVRRLHDTGRSGWWLLISLVPLVRGIVLIAFTLQNSQPGNNRYGPNPKQIPH